MGHHRNYCERLSMSGRQHRVILSVCLAALSLGFVGCGPEMSRLRSERDALFAQNQEAQNLIDDLRRANDALNMENSAIRNDLAGGVPEVDPNAFASVSGVDTVAGANSIAVRVPGDLLFAPGKAELNAASKSTLAQIASIIQSEYPGRRVRVEGYTDTDPITKSNWKDNLELSLHRSAAVYRYLEEQGLAAELMYASGFGSQKARDSKKTSRRVEIVVLLGDD